MLYTTVLVLAALHAASNPDRLLAAVPADALFVASLSDLDDMRKRAADNAWWKLVQDEDLRPLLARARELVDDALDEALDEAMEGEEGQEQKRKVADPWAWIDALHGPATLFVVMKGDEVGGGGLLVEPGPEPAAFDELWQTLVELGREGSSESSQEYQGVELVVQRDLDSEADLHAIFFECEGARALVAGEGREFVLELAQGGIDRLLGKDPSPGFAGSPALAEARRSAPAGRALEVLFDVAGFVRLGLAEDAREREAGTADAVPPEKLALQLRVMERFGFTAMRYAYLAAAFGEDERFDLTMAAHLPAGSILQRASALLRTPSRELLALAPADALGITLGGLDLPGMWQLVRTATEELEPALLAQIDQGVAGFEGMSGLRLEQDILRQLAGEFASVNVSIPPSEIPAGVTEELGEDAAELADAGSATVVRVADGSAFEDVLGRLLRSFGMAGMITEEEYQGHTVSTFGEAGAGVHWCCTDEHFVFSQSPTPLRAVLARIGGEDLPSLKSDARYQRLLEEHTRAVVLTLSDARVAAETLVQVGQFSAGMLEGMLDSEELGNGLSELLTLFPDPAFVAEHIDGVLFQAVEVQPEGVSMRFGGR